MMIFGKLVHDLESVSLMKATPQPIIFKIIVFSQKEITQIGIKSAIINLCNHFNIFINIFPPVTCPR